MPPPPKRPADPDPGAAVLGRKVLVVDDDRLNIRILNSILQGEGYALAEAGSGERALEVYPKFQPDLVLLDVVLPGIDGFETCRQHKKTHGGNCAPVIFITAKNESDDIVEGLSVGGADYLPKPFKEKEVLARIRTHLQNKVLLEQQRLLVEKLNKADAAKTRFLGMAAHDLRNPLASIRGLSEFLREGAVGPLSPEQRGLVDTILGASQSMLNLVNELLDVATIQSGVLKLHLEPHPLADLLAKSVMLTNIQAAEKKTRVVMGPDCAAPMPPIDVGKIRQVIDNLLSNAVKFSPAGATITASIQLDPARGTCGISVRDQGPGIPEGERDKLFKDFSRLSIRPTGGEKSTGLGLAICRNIVEAHHGTIGAENLPMGGCEFRVTLPLAA